MIRRRLVPLVLLVVALLAIVALVARGRPLGTKGGKGGGLPAIFWGYVFTTSVILLVVAAVAGLATYFFFRREPGQRPVAYQARTARSLAILIALAAILAFVGRRIDLYHLLHPGNAHTTSTPTTTIPGGPQGGGGNPGSHPLQFQWLELLVFLGALLALGAIVATRSRLRPLLPVRRHTEELLVAALDESIDDLRAETDLRRAIVAAYARMEATLAAAGLPRRPAEAPLEYLERALLALDASAGAVSRLTDLFEWARFSQHEPEPSMRDEAVDALVAVRDELRAGEPAWA